MNKEQIKAEEQRLFQQYVRYISQKVIEVYGTSYSNADKSGDAWRDTFPYSAEIEKFLFSTTNIFIMRAVKSKNLKFLEHLIYNMADYLSSYTQKNPKFKNGDEAKESAKHVLFDNSKHIKYLKRQQEIQNNLREEKNAEPKKKNSCKKQSSNSSASEFDNAKQNLRVQFARQSNVR